MSREILIHDRGEELEIAVRENGVLVEFYVERTAEGSIVGGIYKGIVRTVIPSMQAAFVDIGVGKNGFLHVSDVVDEPAIYQNLDPLGEEPEAPPPPPPPAPAEEPGVGRLGLAFMRSLKKLGFGGAEEAAPPPPPPPSPVVEEKISTVSRLIPRRPHGGGQPLVQDVLREGQEILVQVTKEGLGTKGPRLTSQIALAGKVTVLMPLSKGGGVSQQIRSRDERRRLRDLCRGLRPNGMGLIVRTAGEGKEEDIFKHEVRHLAQQWGGIVSKAEGPGAPMSLLQDQNVVDWIIRDLVTEDTNRLVADSEVIAKQITDGLMGASPEIAKKTLHFKESESIFKYYLIDKEIENALREKVWLKSGGYLIMNQTEALVAIDVNTGKFTGQGDVREAILRTNLEAADEIARQLRLRNMGGIVIIDFIDMDHRKDQERVLKDLKEACRKDRARTKVYSFTELGLVEMTRKRVRRSLSKSLAESCPTCNGRGFLVKWGGKVIQDAPAEEDSTPAEPAASAP